MKTNNRLIAGGLILASFALAIMVGKERIALQFPAFGSFLNAGYSTDPEQQAAIAAQQQETLVDAEATIAAAEQLTAETPVAAAAPIPQQTMPDDKPWKLQAADSSVMPSRTLDPKIKVFSPVVLEPHPDHLPRAGEQIMLPMFNGALLKVNVESAASNSNGDYIWSGHLAGHDNDYPVVMTYGEKTTFATITTPEGSYSLEAVQGVGWLYKNPAEAELAHQGKNDFLIPDIQPEPH